MRRPTSKREAAIWQNAVARGQENMWGDIRESKGIAAPIMQDIPAPRAPRVKSTEPSEHQLQQAVIEWWGMYRKAHGLPRFALFAIPNGQILMRSAENPFAVMAYLKSEGLREGVLDLFLSVPRGGMHGCYIEMKRPKGIASIEQQAFSEFMASQNYQVALCKSVESAIQTITDYLTLAGGQ